MIDKKEHEDRLKAEAEFQNQRVLAANSGDKEPRDKFYYLAGPAIDHYHRTLVDVAGKKVLVVGCSEGGVTPLAKRGADVTGVDISDAAIESLNRRIEAEGLSHTARAVLMDAQNLDVESGSIDLICCSGVLHHLDVKEAATSWSSALRADGKASLLEPMAWNPLVAAYRILTPSMRTEDEHPLKPEDFRILRNHFDVVRVQGYVLTSVVSLVWAYLPNFFRLKEKSFSVLSAFDQWLLGKFPGLTYFCWTVVIELEGPRKSPKSLM